MIISRTPLRVSFAGGGSDFPDFYRVHGGAVLSAAVDKSVYITVNRRFCPGIRVAYSSVEEVMSVDDVQHNLVREALKFVNVDGPLAMAYVSDMLPAHEGSGLGASSSLLVGTLNALYALSGHCADAEQLADDACKIEIDALEQPIGKQDQYAVAYGGVNFIRFNPDDTVSVEPVSVDAETYRRLSERLLFFYTGFTTQSGVVLSEQKRETARNQGRLLELTRYAEQFRDCLERGELEPLGELLRNGWTAKRQLASAISNPQIDHWYETALAAGATGGKLLGSGGGGFLMFYCEPDRQAAVRSALSTLREVDFQLGAEGSRLIYNQR